MQETQKEKVRQQLLTVGYVTRNWALSRFITRLGAIVYELKQEGLNIEGFYNNDKLYGPNKRDYIYKIKK